VTPCRIFDAYIQLSWSYKSYKTLSFFESLQVATLRLCVVFSTQIFTFYFYSLSSSSQLSTLSISFSLDSLIFFQIPQFLLAPLIFSSLRLLHPQSSTRGFNYGHTFVAFICCIYSVHFNISFFFSTFSLTPDFFFLFKFSTTISLLVMCTRFSTFLTSLNSIFSTEFLHFFLSSITIRFLFVSLSFFLHDMVSSSKPSRTRKTLPQAHRLLIAYPILFHKRSQCLNILTSLLSTTLLFHLMPVSPMIALIHDVHGWTNNLSHCFWPRHYY